MAFLPILIANWRIVLGGLGVVALLTWAGCERAKLINQGAEGARQKIEDANHEAEQKADTGARSVESCFAGGGNWDRAHGLCLPIDPARR